ncbi:MAG: leucine--tRNA ligase [Eubacteriales bacterium]
MKNNFNEIEKKWQDKWESAGVFRAEDDFTKPKFYGLVEFPYPSGVGMHVGHIKAYIGLEAVCRKRRMEGYNVLFPIGFDAFGLPTENTAIKFGTHPKKLTEQNIKKFTTQLKKIGFSFDWSRVVDTTDPEYYKWTQWIFLKMFEHGLVFRDKTLVNYCPNCRVVLSNEDSQGGKCDICHSDVVQRPKDVWYLRITQYADKLLEGLDKVSYPANVRQMQENWIGRSTGAFVKFKLNVPETLEVYTTRPDTLFGATFMVMAPEHGVIDKYAGQIKNMGEITEYRAVCAKKTEFERVMLSKEKTGVKLDGITAVNPINGCHIPVYISDYVMMGYGTGAIMAVPAHDERDYEFAKKFGIEIIEVVKGGDIANKAYAGEGEMVNSGFLNGISSKTEAIEKTADFLAEKGLGKKGVQYKMKDWAFNRQRYWGEPIPIVHCEKCGIVPLPYDELPLTLPPLESFEPGVDGESPLAKIESFVNCECPKCGGAAKRETDIMPQWAGSSWYFLRYIDPHNKKEFCARDKMEYWMSVDWYNGGMEHVTRHMIYSRFWHRFLYDIGCVNTPEPYAKRTAQGLVLGSDGERMSKSRGNVIDPIDVAEVYGADVLRTYTLFMGDYGQSAPWSENGIKGCKRFLDRVAGLTDLAKGSGETKALSNSFHKTVKKVTEDIEEMKFNTAIASLMTLSNEIYENGGLTADELFVFIRLLSPFAPHLCEEINSEMGRDDLVASSKWPGYDVEKTKDNFVEVPVSINGRLRGTVVLPAGCGKEEAAKTVYAEEKIKALLGEMTVVKEVYVPNKIFNIVAK